MRAKMDSMLPDNFTRYLDDDGAALQSVHGDEVSLLVKQLKIWQ